MSTKDELENRLWDRMEALVDDHEKRLREIEAAKAESKVWWALFIGGSGFIGTVATEALIHWLFK